MPLSPAKINLTLAITGRRADGFHELISLVAPLTLADSLTISPAEADRLDCSDPSLPTGPDNLVWKAVTAFRQRTGWLQPLSISLQKHIPHGAGLGGGSSNAATTLLALNRLAGSPLRLPDLSEVAAQVGSDCPLFLHGRPGVMRGRGETFSPLPETAAARLRGLSVFLFKPSFPVSTPWAYQALAARAPASYAAAPAAEQNLAAWENGALPLASLLQNSLQPIVFDKYPALPLLCREIGETFGLPTLMSGSGSCCLALTQPDTDTAALARLVRSRWGDTAWTCDTALL